MILRVQQRTAGARAAQASVEELPSGGGGGVDSGWRPTLVAVGPAVAASEVSAVDSATADAVTVSGPVAPSRGVEGGWTSGSVVRVASPGSSTAVVDRCSATAKVSVRDSSGLALVSAAWTAGVVAEVPSLVIFRVSVTTEITMVLFSALVLLAAGLTLGDAAVVVGVSFVVGAKGEAMLHREVPQQTKSLASVEFTELNAVQTSDMKGK